MEKSTLNKPVFKKSVTFYFSILCLIVYFISRLNPALQDVLFLNNTAYPWQLLTYSISHVTFLHLVTNLVIFFIFGLNLEYIFGIRWYVTLLLGSSLGGGVFHLFMRSSNTAGASAVIFGIIAAITVVAPWAPIKVTKNKKVALIFASSIFLFIGVGGFFFLPNRTFAHASHFGGTISGLTFGILYRIIYGQVQKELV